MTDISTILSKFLEMMFLIGEEFLIGGSLLGTFLCIAVFFSIIGSAGLALADKREGLQEKIGRLFFKYFLRVTPLWVIAAFAVWGMAIGSIG